MDKEQQLLLLKNRLNKSQLKMLDYVASLLSKRNYNFYSDTKQTINYSRYEHTLRVLSWAIRIYDNYEDKDKVDFEALVISSIFHDAGYSHITDLDHHGLYSAKIARAYLEENKYNNDLIEKIEYLIANHSCKELMQKSDTKIELIILMEADLFDETGALGIVLDSQYSTIKQYESYHDYALRIKEHSLFSEEYNPMVLEYSRNMWIKKSRLLNEFYKHLMIDLGEE